MPDTSRPMVSVLMPVRNEAGYIERSLASVLTQDYPSELLEVLVIDGMSDDKTVALVRAVSNAHERAVNVLTNPSGIVPSSLNLGLETASGDVIVRVDGHCEIGRDYVSRCIDLLASSGADCAGGRLVNVGETFMGRCVAIAQAAVFGVGGVAFRTAGGTGRDVDTLAFGAYRKEVFDKIGVFDEDLVRNQDDEFNLRLTQQGGHIWLDPTLLVRYFTRGSLKGLWRQYFQYGYYKVAVIKKRAGVASIRHLVPAAFVLAVALAVILAFATSVVPLIALLLTYLVACTVASGSSAPTRPLLWPVLILVFATMHIAYGTGFLAGLMRWGAWRRADARP